MSYLLGIDIGTSGVKILALREDGKIAALAHSAYSLQNPHPLWAEQNPQDWWSATCEALGEVAQTVPLTEVTAIGLSGQMHSLVALDESGEVLRPAILWCDQRTQEQCRWITEKVGVQTVLEETCNPVLTGFTAPKIIWMREHEPETYERARMFLLPKDYIRYKLTGEFATEVSDASGTSLLNVPQRQWSTLMLDRLEISSSHLPRVYESYEISGSISREGAAATGLKESTPVVGGGGDQAAGAVGNGIIQSGVISVTTGTSGVIFSSTDSPLRDPESRLHTFCHAVPNKWHVMGVMLSAGGGLRWYRDTLCLAETQVANIMGIDPYKVIAQEAEAAPPGGEGLFFLPYLTGERTPHPDPNARGAFIGLTLRHNKAHLARAVMEGVAFGLRDSLEILRSMNISIGNVRASGGGARSEFWRQIQADIFKTTLSVMSVDEGPAQGAALLAGVGAGLYQNIEEACSVLVKVAGTTAPNPENSANYDRYYDVYRTLYPALQPQFTQISELVD